MKFKVGDKVKIIQRKPGNTTGSVYCNQPNGDVGTICYICEYSPEKLILMENKNNTGKYYGMYCMTEDGYFQDDDLELIEDEFVLPERWCIKVTRDNVDVLEEWRNWKGKSLSQEPIHGYLTNNKIWYSSIPDACEEITFEQFKKYVYMSKIKYVCSPFPTNGNYVKLRVVKDIIKSDIATNGSLPDIIPAGSITWAKGSSFEDITSGVINIHPEGNRYSANIPKEYFECIECVPAINTYGLQIGDKLPQDIIRKWTTVGKNRCHTKNGNWEQLEGQFISDRKIISFDIIDNVVGFEVSGTENVYLRAEGFKEFMDSFNEPKFEVGKWYEFNWDFHSKTNGKTIIKVKKVHDKDVYTCDRIYLYRPGDTNFTYEDMYSFTEMSHIREITDLSEIQQYLPEDHPDKIKTMKYPIGKINVINVSDHEDVGDYTKHGNYPKKGYQDFEIIAYYNNLYVVKWIGIDGKEVVLGFKENNLKPYEATTLNVKKDDKGRPLKTFEIGKWYINPCYPLIDGIKYKYFRVSSVEQIKTLDYWYNKFEFDKVADENWNIVDVKKTQSNTNFDQEMQLAENPFQKSLVGRYLRALTDSPQSTPFKKGEYVKILDFYYSDKVLNKYKLENGWCYTTDNSSANNWELMPEGFIPNTETKPEIVDNLIEEAKRRYPVGTKFFPAHISDNTSEYCIITEDCKFVRDEDDVIYSKITTAHRGISERWVDRQIFPEYGNTSYNRNVYFRGKWAEIMEEVPKSEDWIPKINDWVVLMKGGHNWNSGMNKYVGKCVQLKELKNKERSFWVIKEDNGKWVWEYSNRVKHFRKAEPHEIPKTEEPKSKPMNEYTAEEALPELKKRGFKKGVEYTYKHDDDNYDEDDICTAPYDPAIRDNGSFIDCGRGYLWNKDYPSVLHRGPISSPTNNDYPLTLDEVFEEFNKPNYFKPETLLPKTTLNY